MAGTTNVIIKQLGKGVPKQMVKDFMNEVIVMKECNHGNVLRMLGTPVLSCHVMSCHVLSMQPHR